MARTAPKKEDKFFRLLDERNKKCYTLKNAAAAVQKRSAIPMGKFLIDHDLHIHSQLSLCSHDPLQTPERILRYAQENGLKNICLTDHFWDEKVPGASSFDFYARQDFAHVTQALPLPQSDSVRFHFGCETDIDKFLHLGLSRERMDCF